MIRIKLKEVLEDKEEIIFNINLINILSENLTLDDNNDDFIIFCYDVENFFKGEDYRLIDFHDNGKTGIKRSIYWIYKKVENGRILKAVIKLRVSNHRLSSDSYVKTLGNLDKITKDYANEFNQTKGLSHTLINVNGEKFSGFNNALNYIKSELSQFERDNLVGIDFYIYDGKSILKDTKKKLERIEIKNGLTKISKDAFNGCISLENILIPNSIKRIESNAFKECLSLEELELPKSVIFIDEGAFNKCYYLKTITILNDNKIIIDDKAFIDCPELVIQCYKNSYVEDYCINHNLKVRSID